MGGIIDVIRFFLSKFIKARRFRELSDVDDWTNVLIVEKRGLLILNSRFGDLSIPEQLEILSTIVEAPKLETGHEWEGEYAGWTGLNNTLYSNV